MEEKETTKISKFLSLVLRHKPEVVGIELDENGWTDVSVLIQKCNAYGIHFDFPMLKHVVDTNNKKRFSFDDSLTKIRASQGHSINIDLGYEPKIPPEILFHGTGLKFVESILNTGLEKRNRNHVHLSIDIETAVNVGKRHGKPVVFKIFSGNMVKDCDYKFYLSDNGVWLTDNVPPKYLELLADR
jgi:putative RNA 2'-phosphotransferase